MKKKLRYVLVAILPFLFIIIFLILIVSSAAAAAAGGTGDDNTISSNLKNTEEYQLCISLQNEFSVPMYQIYVLYLLADENAFSDDDIRNAAIWINENSADDNAIANYYLTTDPYKTQITVKNLSSILSSLESAKTIIELDSENTAMVTNSIRDVNSDAYQKDNPFTQGGYRGQCTWYVWGRVYETTGKRMPTGNAQTWYYTTTFEKGHEPRTGAVAVFSGGDFGHVAYIEKVKNGEITYSEGNYENPYIGTTYMVTYANTHYAELLHEATISATRFPYVNLSSGFRLLGYIYP